MKTPVVRIAGVLFLMAVFIVWNAQVREGLDVGREYKTYTDTDYTNQGDTPALTTFTQKAGTSTDVCKKLCDGLPGCGGFVQNSVGACYFKDTAQLTTPSVVSGTTFYYKVPPANPSTTPTDPPSSLPPSNTTASPPMPPPPTPTPVPAPPTTPAPPEESGMKTWQIVLIVLAVLLVVVGGIIMFRKQPAASAATISPSIPSSTPTPVVSASSDSSTNKLQGWFDSAQSILKNPAAQQMLKSSANKMVGRIKNPGYRMAASNALNAYK